MSLLAQAHTKQNTNLKKAFRNEEGAIDLASIMVGIIVIGLIGGVIAATVFAVIPWAQDNAAKQQLDAVVTAQSAKAGLNDGKYSTDLSSFLDTSSAKVGVRSNNSDCYGAFVTSASGNSYYVSSSKSQPVKIAANATWPANKPTDYPNGCSWPGSKGAAATTSTVQVQNFIVNPSFEVDKNNAQSAGNKGKSSVRLASTTAHSGDYVMRVTRNDTTDFFAYTYNTSLTSLLEPGDYVFSMQVRSNTSVILTPYVERYQWPQAYEVTDNTTNVTTTGEWQTITQKIKIGTPTYARLGFIQSSGDYNGPLSNYVEVDSVQLVKSTGNFAADSSFNGL
jgi:hypothetical protein